MKQTENYGLNLPEESDFFDIQHFNENAQAIDGELKGLREADENFVTKESGKQLSTNDYTTAEKTKLAGIAEGAEVNVQANWTETNTASDAYIKNKPSTFTPSSHTHDDRYYTESEMNTKLAGKSDTSHSHTSFNSLTLASLKMPNRGVSGGIQFGVLQEDKSGYKDYYYPRIYSNTGKDLHIGLYASTEYANVKEPFNAEIILSGCSATMSTNYVEKEKTTKLNLEIADLMYTGSLTHQSDRHAKKNISVLSDDRYLTLFDKINLSTFQFKGNNPGLTEPPHSRYHLGVIAQDLQDSISDCGIDDMEFSAVKAKFFIPNTSDNCVTGGWRTPKEGYDYSENVYRYKHDLDYEFINEVMEKPMGELTFDDYRENIQYIMFEDNAKVAHEHKQPPLKVNSICLVDKEGNIKALPLDLGGVAYYEQEDLDMSKPLSGGNCEDGALTITYDKMYGSYLLKISDEGIRWKDYESIIFDIDFIGEYKIYFLPACEMKNANVWDRKRNPKLIYDYSVDYEQLYLTAMYALQETRKEFARYKEDMAAILEGMEQRIEKLEGGNEQ